MKLEAEVFHIFEDESGGKLKRSFMSFERIGIAFIEAEVALRKSLFLKGYELGKGRPLTNEEQQEVVDTLYQNDSLAQIREERTDLTQSIET